MRKKAEKELATYFTDAGSFLPYHINFLPALYHKPESQAWSAQSSIPLPPLDLN